MEWHNTQKKAVSYSTFNYSSQKIASADGHNRGKKDISKNDSRLCIIPVLVIMCYVKRRVENSYDETRYFGVWIDVQLREEQRKVSYLKVLNIGYQSFKDQTSITR